MRRHLCLVFALSLAIQTPKARASPSYYDYSQVTLFALTFVLQWNRVYYPKTFFLIRFANLLNALSHLYEDCSNLSEKERLKHASCALNFFFAAVDTYYLSQTIYDYRHPTTTVLRISRHTCRFTTGSGETIAFHRAILTNSGAEYELTGRVPSQNIIVNADNSIDFGQFPKAASLFPLDFMRSSRSLRIFFGEDEIVKNAFRFSASMHNFLKFGPGFFTALIYHCSKMQLACFQFAGLLAYGEYVESTYIPSDGAFDISNAVVGTPFMLTRGEKLIHAAIFIGQYNGEILTLSKLGITEIVFASLAELHRFYDTDGLISMLPNL